MGYQSWRSMRAIAASTILTLVISACGGGGGGDPATSEPESPAPASKAEAARFLARTSFGPTVAEIDRLAAGMSYEAWLNEQFAAPPNLHLPLFTTYASGDRGSRVARLDAWFERALTGNDQLRQRVAFALSEIMVVSENGGGLNNFHDGLASYYDVLVRNAFGDFRTLLEEVTLAPAMGRYLSMMGNQKPDPATGLRADENYAREVMQLFTLGLAQLNADGTPKTDGAGQPLPSYTQADIENLARVFTGWWLADARAFGNNRDGDWTKPMVAHAAYHDSDAKTIVGAVAIPAGGSAQQDLDRALDALANHANVGPFIGRQLIQKLVTSNPSPAYVARVAAVFANNGHGQRGDLRAVVRAILLDDEALRGTAGLAHFGKPREPLLVLLQLWRSIGATRSSNGRYTYLTGNADLGQSPLGAPSVFNFFSPFYAPPGEIGTAQLVAPELQLANESSIASAFNRYRLAIFRDYVGGGTAPANAIRVDLAALMTQAADPAALVETLSLRLTGGRLGANYRSALSMHLGTIAAGDGRARVQDALYLILTSPQYLVQQ